MAVAPALAGRGMSSGALATTVIMQFVIGLLLVWLYAAMRPRFGPGMKTATYAALAVWVCGFVFHLDWLLVGLMTPATYAMASVMAFIQVGASAAVGGMMYKRGRGPIMLMGGAPTPPRTHPYGRIHARSDALLVAPSRLHVVRSQHRPRDRVEAWQRCSPRRCSA